MKHFLATGFLCVAMITTLAQSVKKDILGREVRELVSPRLLTLSNSLREGKADSLVLFWENIKKSGAPIVESYQVPDSVLVTFLFRSLQDVSVVLISDFGSSIGNLTLRRLANSDIWYKTLLLPADAIFLYRFSVNDPAFPFEGSSQTVYPSTFQIDSLNPAVYARRLSFTKLPGAPNFPFYTKVDSLLRGVTIKLPQRFKSNILKNERNIYVYTPAGYSPEDKRYPLLVFGTTYMGTVPLPTILDNLIKDGKIPKVVAVFVDYPDQHALDRENACYKPYSDFLAKELIPFIRKEFHVSPDADKTIIGGASFGGLSATCVALDYPMVFGKVIAQSANFWWKPDSAGRYNWIFDKAIAAKDPSIEFFLTAGSLENGYAFRDGLPNTVDCNENFKAVLRAKGFKVHLSTVAATHDPFNWQRSVAEALIHLLKP